VANVVRRRIVVDGRVQGVFFRASAEREAARRGLTGFARNRGDGSVELAVEGPEDAVDQFVAWARVGPPRATVTSVEVNDEAPTGEPGFRAF